MCEHKDVPSRSQPQSANTDSPSTVLLVEDDQIDAGLILKALFSPEGCPFKVEWVSSLADALARLARGGVDVVLLDLSLPDGEGVEAFEQVLESAREALILVLSTEATEDAARLAVRRGATDYLAKDHADAYWLPRALRYVSERRATEQALRLAEERMFEEKERGRVTLDSIGDAVLSTDLEYRVTYLNPVAEELTGWTHEQALQRSLSEVFNIIDGSTRRPAANPARRAIEQDRTVGLEMNCVLIRRDGSETVIEDSAAPIHNREGRVTGAVIVFDDASQARDVTSKMAHLAQHDVLTGLANRVLLEDRCAQAISLALRHGGKVGLLFLDLDRFKSVNDVFGHTTGDSVLQSAASRMLACVRASDTVCRYGGDEFVVLLSEIRQVEDAVLAAEKLQAAFNTPQTIDGHTFRLGLSIGISIYPDDGERVADLLRHADAAMLRAKANGRNCYRLFDAALDPR